MDLNSPIEKVFRLAEEQKKALKKLKLETVRELLFYFPSRYSDIRELKLIKELIPGETSTIYGQIIKTATKKGFRSKIPMGEVVIKDLSGQIKAIWFHQAYAAKMIKVGQSLKLTGRVTEGKSGIYLANPEFEQLPIIPIDIHDSLFAHSEKKHEIRFPIYPETRGLSSKWIYHAIQKIIKAGVIENMEDYIPHEILKKYSLPSLRSALIWIHMPKKEEDATAARKRFAFEEVFFIQLERQHDRMEFAKNKSFRIKADNDDIQKFLSRFPFKPTPAQEKANLQILSDLEKPRPMSRLLEGDVGSGKTLVAAVAAHTVVNTRPFAAPTVAEAMGGKQGHLQDFGNLQVAYMAPTEILAGQHFESFISYFKHLPINIGLITGSGCKKFPSKVNPGGWTTISRAQLLKWVGNGEIPILIGTHALIQKAVNFKHLALVIVDEQHRFGTNQRMKLARKQAFAPHFLSMTATPIPRTLALTIYGDLDLTLLDEMPAGRKQIITEIVRKDRREETYEKIRTELKASRQLYVICPRIDEPDPDKERALQAKSVTAEAKRLKDKVFPEYEIGILHSKMTKEKKEKIMKDFSENKIHILCATSVVEVGVNVPNATIIIIEGAERFGLAQLHQLRGRVIRSTHQAYCYTFTETKSDKSIERLKALKTAKNGFELSELDLALRGPGELSGTKQWGISDLGMEAIKNIKMVEAARTEAQALIKTDPELENYPLLKQMVKLKTDEFHFE
ncbi:MAG: ATP-dependent DNA helicase RecG [Candidatus Nomurabacteria bacterium GW2011_GWB1_37_5]|uniref:Probable DNA 3'-5' helicase RecG n=1 Tax=Candidatus Nomurabacteria bacterium GW2011_GWB1_37_5 TaxID=1618742 RepID=A0A0G0H1F7_9BACT|nr:MAG: ATP-dependent DNA helicase RecG [Candidatus Nomurabacteria bacterium GW2011_GWB1_37_5]